MNRLTLGGLENALARRARWACIGMLMASSWASAAYANGIDRIGGRTAEQVFSRSLDAELAKSACAGDILAVQGAIRRGANPNAVGFGGATPLFWAEECESLSGMEELLKSGANPNYQFPEKGGFSAVGAAAGMKDPAFLKLLLRYRGDPNSDYAESPWTALQRGLWLGTTTGQWDNYYNLLQAGADVNRVHAGGTIGTFAASLHQFQKVEELLKLGYSHDLKGLAAAVSVAYVSAGTQSEKDKVKLLALIEERQAAGR